MLFYEKNIINFVSWTVLTLEVGLFWFSDLDGFDFGIWTLRVCLDCSRERCIQTNRANMALQATLMLDSQLLVQAMAVAGVL